MKAFDAIIIGTGQSGPSLAHRLADAGMRVAIIERHRFGGTCVNTGCTPTKTLVASAYAAHMARRAGEYGVRIEGAVSVDMKKVRARKDYVLGFSTRGVERGLMSKPNITVYRGHGRFAGQHEVLVARRYSRRLASSSTWAAVPSCPPYRGWPMSPISPTARCSTSTSCLSISSSSAGAT